MPAETSVVAKIAGRYATALFDLAKEEKALDEVARDLERLAAMMEESEDLRRLVRSPLIAWNDQAKAMAALMQRAEIGSLVQRAVGVVARNQRLFALDRIIGVFQRLLAEHRGEVAAQVSSAKALSQAQLKAVTASLSRAVGSDVNVTAQVDPELIGGLVVRVGSRMIDSSIRTKLQRLQLAMKGVG